MLKVRCACAGVRRSCASRCCCALPSATKSSSLRPKSSRAGPTACAAERSSTPAARRASTSSHTRVHRTARTALGCSVHSAAPMAMAAPGPVSCGATGATCAPCAMARSAACMPSESTTSHSGGPRHAAPSHACSRTVACTRSPPLATTVARERLARARRRTPLRLAAISSSPTWPGIGPPPAAAAAAAATAASGAEAWGEAAWGGCTSLARASKALRPEP
eukprot:scaffold24947_cov73-Phaeocystis_antarctica.AAC.2